MVDLDAFRPRVVEILMAMWQDSAKRNGKSGGLGDQGVCAVNVKPRDCGRSASWHRDVCIPSTPEDRHVIPRTTGLCGLATRLDSIGHYSKAKCLSRHVIAPS